ncbi:MAG: 50S ribosomal protein L15 [Patescibacteria group bacterium]|nr:50S ribosomal protein L15 [Patescibacteria group bacterium]
MTLSLSELKGARGARRQPKRVGRGNASGKGTTAGKGTKGQRARTGGRNRITLLGIRRLVMSTPKLRGFKSQYPQAAAVNVGQLAAFGPGVTVDLRALKAKGLVPSPAKRAKILGGGELKKKIVIAGLEVSASAKAKIEAAGGTIR